MQGGSFLTARIKVKVLFGECSGRFVCPLQLIGSTLPQFQNLGSPDWALVVRNEGAGIYDHVDSAPAQAHLGAISFILIFFVCFFPYFDVRTLKNLRNCLRSVEERPRGSISVRHPVSTFAAAFVDLFSPPPVFKPLPFQHRPPSARRRPSPASLPPTSSSTAAVVCHCYRLPQPPSTTINRRPSAVHHHPSPLIAATATVHQHRHLPSVPSLLPPSLHPLSAVPPPLVSPFQEFPFVLPVRVREPGYVRP